METLGENLPNKEELPQGKCSRTANSFVCLFISQVYIVGGKVNRRYFYFSLVKSMAMKCDGKSDRFKVRNLELGCG